MSWLYQPLLPGGAQQQSAVAYTLSWEAGTVTVTGQPVNLTQTTGGGAAAPAPGPLFLSPKAYRELQKRRRKAEDEIEALRKAEQDRRSKLRAMIGRAVRGEAEPVAKISPEEPPAPTIRKSRKVAPAVYVPDPEIAARMADLLEEARELKARIEAHERAEAEEEDDMEALLLFAA